MYAPPKAFGATAGVCWGKSGSPQTTTGHACTVVLVDIRTNATSQQCTQRTADPRVSTRFPEVKMIPAHLMRSVDTEPPRDQNEVRPPAPEPSALWQGQIPGSSEISTSLRTGSASEVASGVAIQHSHFLAGSLVSRVPILSASRACQTCPAPRRRLARGSGLEQPAAVTLRVWSASCVLELGANTARPGGELEIASHHAPQRHDLWPSTDAGPKIRAAW